MEDQDSSGSILIDKEGSLRVPSSVNTPPPGFSLSDANLFYGGNISRSAAASAPPTSLFGTEFNFNDAVGNGNGERAPRIRQIPLSDVDNATTDDPIFAKSRTMSYNNLAMALGEGLAECMVDSLDDSKQQTRERDMPSSLR